MSLSLLAFLGFYGSGLVLAFVRHPIFGLFTYMLAFYVHPPSRWWGALLPDLRWSLLAGVVTLIAVSRHEAAENRPGWLTTRPAKILLVFTVWVWIQNIWALSPDEHFELSILFTKYVLLFFLIYRLVETPAQVRLFLLVQVLGAIYLGWLAYQAPDGGRLEGVGGPGIDEANALAMQLGTGAAIAAMFILAERGYLQWCCVLGMGLILNGVVQSGSRGGFLAIMCGGVALWYLKPYDHRRLFYFFAVLGVSMFLIVAQETFWERMGTITTAVENREEADTSAQSRFALVEAQMKMAAAYPLGAGHRGTAVLSPQYLDARYLTLSVSAPGVVATVAQRSSHNTFMTALVEQGIPGAIMFTWLWAWAIFTLLRLGRLSKTWSEGGAWVAGIGGALGVVFVAGQFVDYLKAEVQVWLFAALASLDAYSRVAARTGAAQPTPAPEPARGALTRPRGAPALRPPRGTLQK